MNDAELLKKASKAAQSDEKLKALVRKIEDGEADFQDMAVYSERLSKLIGSVLADEGADAEAAEKVMQEYYRHINAKEAKVQAALDRKANLHIRPQKAKFPAERVRQAAQSLEDKTVEQEVIERRARNAVANIANSFHDDYIQENAYFRSNAGLRCYVARIGASKCCAWCAEVAGRFEVGSEPSDFWRRHDNCTCQISYENNKVRQRLSGNGKGWKVDSETQRRRAQRIQYKPATLSPEQARELEAQKLSQYRGLTSENSKLKTDTPQTIVDKAMLHSPEYRNLFDQLGEPTQITRKIFHNSRTILEHRTGTEFEDLVFIDSTGKVLSRTDYDVARQVIPSKRMQQMVMSSPEYSVISIHNHPGSAVPSLADINSARNLKYKYGVIACHNGNLFKYTILNSNYPEEYSDMLLDKINRLLYNNTNDETDKASTELDRYLTELENFGVKLEVFKWK